MQHVDRDPEFSESSSSSAMPPERQQEMSRSAYTPAGSTPFEHNQEGSSIYQNASARDQSMPPDAHPSQTPIMHQSISTDANPSQTPIMHQSVPRVSYLIVAGTIIAALLIGGLGGWLLGQYNSGAESTNVDNSAQQAQTEQVAERFRTAVVQIDVQRSPTELSIGSGVLINPHGYIVTNNHVVESGQSISVTLYDGSVLPAQLTGTDPADDLAVVHITPPRNIAVASIGDSSKLRVGESVLAIGNPLGITQTVTAGIVSALGRTIPEGTGNAVILNAVQTDAAINPGNSGGALVDMQGNLVGIPTLVPIDPEFNSPANGVGFAIPSNRVQFIAPQLIDSGKVLHSGRASLGIKAIDVDSTIAAQNQLPVDHGALIVGLVSNGPAEQAGLKIGDIIVQIDNTPIANTQDLQNVILRKDIGQIVSLSIYRGNQQLTAKVRLGELQV
jgi:putative serine protease PepD